MSQNNFSTTTLDPERTTLLRDFLIEEARSSVAPTIADVRQRSTRATPAGRRVAVGVGVAAVIGVGIFGANAVVGGPGPVATSQAVAIESADGWATIRVADPDVDPDAVLQQLEAAGIDARIEVALPDETGLRTIDLRGGSVGVANPGAIGADGFAGLTVSSPHLDEIFGLGLSVSTRIDLNSNSPRTSIAGDPLSPAPNDPAAQAAFEEFQRSTATAIEQEGVRFDDDGSISIRSDSDAEVVILAVR